VGESAFLSSNRIELFAGIYGVVSSIASGHIYSICITLIEMESRARFQKILIPLNVLSAEDDVRNGFILKAAVPTT
jgi:hypothetical protein